MYSRQGAKEDDTLEMQMGTNKQTKTPQGKPDTSGLGGGQLSKI